VHGLFILCEVGNLKLLSISDILYLYCDVQAESQKCRARINGWTVTNKKLIQEEIKRRLNLGNDCYNSVQDLLSSCMLPKNIKIRIYKTIIFPVV
jgi:hypothetical protein